MPEFQPMTLKEACNAIGPAPTQLEERLLGTIIYREFRLRRAVEAMAELVAWQNGCPLETEKWKKGWGEAMRRCKASLTENADLLIASPKRGSP